MATLASLRREIAEALGMARTWVTKYDEEPTQPHKQADLSRHDNFIESNVWGLENGKIQKCDPEQPDSQFHHGSTPAFVVENLVEMYKPKIVYERMVIQ